MDENLYDEFGNYIGPELAEEDDDAEEREFEQDLRDLRGETEDQEEEDEDEDQNMQIVERVEGNEIVLHEDKRYYPEAEEVYRGVETLVMEEDAQPITQPIIEPTRTKFFDILEKEVPETVFSLDFMAGLSLKPGLIRNISVVGHLHHGKTTLMDMFMQNTHYREWDPAKNYKYTDVRMDELERELSIKSTPVSLVLQDLREKSYLFNIMDTPGHPNFIDEVVAGLRISDGVIVVVDAIEGVMFGTEKVIKQAVQEGLEIVVVINKIDRLVLELKMPPPDAYHKLKHTLEEINLLLSTCSHTKQPTQISPLNSNVIFASSQFGCCFTLQSFATIYSQMHGNAFKPDNFAKFLWGDMYYNEDTRKFQRKASTSDGVRSFVYFILEPFYKIVAHTISEERNELMPVLKKLGIYLKKKDYTMDTRPLLKLVLQKIFGDVSCIVDCVVKHIPSAKEATKYKVERHYSGQLEGEIDLSALSKCDPHGQLYVNIVKLYHKHDCSSFDAFGRIISGTLNKGDHVKVLGENYNTDDEEDMAVKEVTNLWINEARYKIEINKACAGNWVLIEGIDASITKSATLISANEKIKFEIFRPLKFFTEAVVKVACEPLNPSELPKMLEGLRKINKSYSMAKTKVEESGEHIVIGTGELYMDCIFHDLRKVKISS